DVAKTELLTNAIETGVGDRLWDVSYSPDGTVIVVAGDLGFRLFRGDDLQPLSPVLKLPLFGFGLKAIAFGPNQTMFIISGDTGPESAIAAYNWKTGVPLGPLVEIPNVHSVAFASNGRLVVCGQRDGSLRLLAGDTLQEIGVVAGLHNGPIREIMSRDDGSVITTDDQGAVLLWDLRLDSWQSRAVQTANRPLSQSEI